MNTVNTLPAPRTISDKFEVFGFEYSIGDGLSIGLENYDIDLDSPIYIDYDEDEPNYYLIEGVECYSLEEAIDMLQDIAENPEDFGLVSF